LFILDHNFLTRNARKLIKGSKDSDSSLVSNENFSETLWPSGWCSGPGNMSHNDPKTTLLMASVTKNLHPKPPKIFSSAIC